MEYFNIATRSPLNFQIFIGGRGIGKTYSALKECLSHKFLYLRRTEKEIEACASEIANPFKKINSNEGLNISSSFNSKLSMGSFTNNGQIIGYSGALSTFSGLRSMDFSDVEIIVFDEFIPERHKVKIREEGNALLNLYETVSRNRELEGLPPVKLYLLANAISLDNDILRVLGAIPIIQSMITGKHSRYSNKERSLYIEFVKDSPVSEAKRQTALYRLTHGSEFEQHALDNEFVHDSMNRIQKQNVMEYNPFLMFGEYTLFSHKSREEWYIAKVNSNIRRKLPAGERDKLKSLIGVQYRILTNTVNIWYDSYETKLFFDSVLIK